MMISILERLGAVSKQNEIYRYRQKKKKKKKKNCFELKNIGILAKIQYRALGLCNVDKKKPITIS